MRVLVVDDEQMILTAMQRLLRDSCAVDCAGGAIEAMEKVKQVDYDFVLLDYMMPNHDGRWFMRNCQFPSKTKIILVTGYANKELVRQMFELGISGYMVKPITREEVLQQFESLSRPCAA